MANQNILKASSMMFSVVVLLLLAYNHVSAVHFLQDSYTESITPRKMDIGVQDEGYVRIKRDADGPNPTNSKRLNYTDVYLEGTEQHREAYMHWSGKRSNVIYILTRRRDPTGRVSSSKLWYSQDYGSSYKTVPLGRPGKPALITFFYVSPANNTRLIFADTANRKLYITYDELQQVDTIDVPFIPDWLMPHPRIADYVLGYSLNQMELFISRDFGHTWESLHEGVTQRVFWGDKRYNDETDDIVHIEVQSSNGKAQYKKCSTKKTDCRKQEYDASVGTFDVISMLVCNEYIFVQKTIVFESVMYVSYNRSEFQRAYFPPKASTKDFLVVNYDEGQVFMAVNHVSSCNLYLSDVTGQFYVLTMEDTGFKPSPGWFNVDIYEVKGIVGTYIANKRTGGVFKTYITFDKGGNWKQLPPPIDNRCPTKNCSLHIQIRGIYGPGILSETKAPGILITHGNIGSHLEPNPSVFVSRDGGWTWTLTPLPNGIYKFNLLDQGSVMTAVEDASLNLTHIVHYSLDEGKTWQNKSFLSNKSIGVDGVLNEPGISSLIASVYGHEKQGGVWAVVKLDFSSLNKAKCKDSDYELWTPADQIDGKQCILGRKITFERRKQDSICFNGKDYERAINFTTCPCTDEDFECDYGYESSGLYTCKQASWFDENSILNECPEAEPFNKSQGYRRIASDKCTGDVPADKYKPKTETCPTMKPGDLTIITDQVIAATNSQVVFKVSQGQGSKKSTVYTWSFNGTKVTKHGLKNSTVTHVFPKYGSYLISLNAKNANGSTIKTMILRVEDKITDTIVKIPWATKVGHLTDFDIDVFGPLVHHNRAHIHFLWTFGDEEGETRPALSWERRIQHAYVKKGNFTVTVEAINSVSTIFKQEIVQVFDSGSIIRLGFSPNAEKFQFEQRIFSKLMFLQLLREVLKKTYGLSNRRLDLHLHSTSPVLVDVLLLTSEDKEDITVDEVVKRVKKASHDNTLVIRMDGIRDLRHVINVTSAQEVTDNNSNMGGDKGPNLRAVYIAIPVLLCAAIVTILVLVYYRKKFRESRRYSILRQRSDSDALLGGDDEDDPPLDLNPEFGGGERTDDDQLDLGTGSHLVMVTGRGDGADNSINC